MKMEKFCGCGSFMLLRRDNTSLDLIIKKGKRKSFCFS